MDHTALARILKIGIIAVSVVLAAIWFAVVDASSHSVSDTLRPWIVGVIVIALCSAAILVALDRLSRPRPR